MKTDFNGDIFRMTTNDPWLDVSARLCTLEFLTEILFAREMARLPEAQRIEAIETIIHLTKYHSFPAAGEEGGQLSAR